MYSTCLFCHTSLGANDLIERFPVGRVLAFDAAKGRLWVVCRKCHRWNLTPLEERWEAIEDCERRFRAVRARVSTGEVGLCRLSEGLSLVRIGHPLLPEMAAWRYGRQLTQRWKRRIGVGVVGVSLSAVGFATASAFGLWQLAFQFGAAGAFRFAFTEDPLRGLRKLQPLRLALDSVGVSGVHVVKWDLAWLRRIWLPTEQWQLCVPYEGPWEEPLRELTATGPAAMVLAGQLLATANTYGGPRSVVENAIAQLQWAGGPTDLFRSIAQAQGRSTSVVPLADLPHDQRLALEMASNDETERRAMEGELAELEASWREAEEIAAIADNMFLPASVGEFIQRHRSGGGGSDDNRRKG